MSDYLEGYNQSIHAFHKLDHPNIARFFETYDDNKYMYTILEYVDGV